MAVADNAMIDEARQSQITSIIEAASNHDNRSLSRLIDTSNFVDCKAVDVQDSATGYTPLHATISTCFVDEKESNDKIAHEARETIKLLLENGAIWNQLDHNNETPGCIAFRLGLDILYQPMVDAGVRAEMLLNRLDEYDELCEEDESEEAGNETLEQQTASLTDQQIQIIDAPTSETSTSAATAHDDMDSNSTTYLSSTLSLANDKILDAGQNGVMMAWESDIMKQSANSLLPSPNSKILNIGFGMGIIDSHIQAHANRPTEHHIIEAHPDVLASMRQNGWFDKSGVTVHAGRWQDILVKLVEDGTTFDAVYYDTFAETYKDFKDFFTEYLLSLLEQDGRWSFFNGMGADRQISYDVYQKIVELDLFEAGFEVDWSNIDLPDLTGEWNGVKRRYWSIQSYRLPLCKFMD